MHARELGPINEYLPIVESQGNVLVVSDYRMLNLGHATALCKGGYAVYTAVTCSDVPRVFETFGIANIGTVVFASLVHGWHHQEGEERPASIPPKTDVKWHTRNFAQVVETIVFRQGTPPRVLIADDLITHDWYDISRDALVAADISYQTYAASNPYAIVGLVESSGV